MSGCPNHRAPPTRFLNGSKYVWISPLDPSIEPTLKTQDEALTSLYQTLAEHEKALETAEEFCPDRDIDQQNLRHHLEEKAKTLHEILRTLEKKSASLEDAGEVLHNCLNKAISASKTLLVMSDETFLERNLLDREHSVSKCEEILRLREQCYEQRKVLFRECNECQDRLKEIYEKLLEEIKARKQMWRRRWFWKAFWCGFFLSILGGLLFACWKRVYCDQVVEEFIKREDPVSGYFVNGNTSVL